MRNPARRWSLCVLLLLATMLNYMDRQVLSSSALRLQEVFHLSDARYGTLESAFSITFAAGGLVFGWLADRFDVRWLYALSVLAWSGAGLATAFAGSFGALIACRAFLGFAESGHWPCAIRTTQRLLPAPDRPLGNGLLQAGAAVGAFLTPLLILWLAGIRDDWRLPFVLIGCAGVVWAVAWSALSPRAGPAAPADPAAPPGPAGEGENGGSSLAAVLLDRRLWVLAALSSLFNVTWQFLRAWLPKYLEGYRGYSHDAALGFTALYYCSAGIASVSCGWITLVLGRRILGVARARLLVLWGAALLATAAAAAPFVPSGPPLEAALLIAAFGSLGVFPNFYSLTQEISVGHQGKVTAVMGLSCWLAVAPAQWITGLLIDHYARSERAELGYLISFLVAAALPLAGVLLLAAAWPRGRPLLDEGRGAAS